MRYLSVCSGIEAATVAWHDLGWKPVAFSEIEKFPSQVLKHHYPDVPNLGDMTKYKEWKLNESIDILVGGTPCQSFSIAGLRQGLQDPRGNLMLTYLGILDKFRPKWCVWENVPGVLSSNGGRDFSSFLGALVELGYGFSYRVLDAQHFGVPQRRRRVFVVGCLGDWVSTAKVLFEPESLLRDSKKSRSKKQGVASSAQGSSPDGKHTVGTLMARDYKGFGNHDIKDGRGLIVYENHPTTARWGTGGGNVPFALAENTIGRQPLNGGNGTGFTEGGPMYTLNATGVHGVAVDRYNLSLNEKTTQTLRGFGHIDHVGGTFNNMAVRRLTPVECERLQGFPDNHTNIPWRKKEKCPDGPRYKALGNSMAVPVMAWIGKRIQEML